MPPFNTLALALAAAGVIPIEDALRPAKRKPKPHATRSLLPAPSYPVPPWRKPPPPAAPPPPPLACGWTVELGEQTKDVFLESKTRFKKNGQPETIKMTLVTRSAVLTSAAAHSYELRAMPGKGSTIKVLQPKDLHMIAALESAIAEIEAHGERVPHAKEGKPPVLAPHCKAEIAALRDEIQLLGTRHLPVNLRPDLTARLGPVAAETVLAYLLP